GSTCDAAARAVSYSGMTMAVHSPEAAWNRARLFTASPRPPLRANGASSATRCTTRTGFPDGDRSGGATGTARAGVPSGAATAPESRDIAVAPGFWETLFMAPLEPPIASRKHSAHGR